MDTHNLIIKLQQAGERSLYLAEQERKKTSNGAHNALDIRDHTRAVTRENFFQGQHDTILAIINDTATYRQGMSGCFYPHHQLDFYNNQNKIVAEYSICFQCNQISASKKSPRMLDGMLSDNGALNFESYFKRIGLPLESK